MRVYDNTGNMIHQLIYEAKCYSQFINIFDHNYISRDKNMLKTKKLLKFSLAISTSSFLSYHLFLNRQQRQNVNGFYRSITNSSRASLILFRSIYDYYYQLRDIPYNTEDYHKKRSEIHSRVAKRILGLSQQNKGIYLKLGQYLGNLQKVVPWEFTEVLKVLQDSGPSIPYQQIKVTIQDDLGKDPQQIYEQFDKTAIAAASLAQVHRAVLKGSKQVVAVKIQFPFLKIQSKYDLIVLRKITQFCNYLMTKRKFNDVDLVKLFQTWTGTLVEQLDFRTEVNNALKTKQLFKANKKVYVPIYYKKYSQQRVITMEFIQGVKINDKQNIQKMTINPEKVANNLIDIFTTMIFKHGFIHCDAHPGNILVRKASNSVGHQIILLDHGLYRTVDKQFVKNFSGLWLSLIQSNGKKVKQYAFKLNIQRHIEYLPIIFLLRTINSTKRFGDPMTPEQKKYFRERDLANFQSINNILQDLPPDLMFIIRASNLIAIHNLALGGTTRNRLFEYTKHSLMSVYGNGLSYFMHSISIVIKIWMYQYMHFMYKFMFGTLKLSDLQTDNDKQQKIRLKAQLAIQKPCQK